MVRRRSQVVALAAGCVAALVPWAVAAGEVVFLPDGEPATLRAALEAAKASSDATVLVVPAGEWDYHVEKIIIDQVDGLVLIGAGQHNTRLFRSECSGGAMLRIEDSDSVRVTGITFDGCDDPSSGANAVGLHLWDTRDFRVDRCTFQQHGWVGVRSKSEDVANRGVVDHCSFERMYKTGLNLGYGVSVSGLGVLEGVPFGSPSATFVEDCTFERTRHAVASAGGARYVFRYNEVTQNVVSHAVDAHGHEGSAPVGTEWVDVYGNLIDQPIYDVAAVRIRGGKGLVWDNRATGYQYGVSLWHKTSQPTGPIYIWDNDWGSGVQGVGDIQDTVDPGGVNYVLDAPPGYVPFTYPHPLVTDLDARAGLDQNVIESDGDWAPTFLDATFSQADAGSIVGYRWYDDGALISTCARDIVALDHGSHLVLLEVERSDGLLEYDTTLIRAHVDAPISSNGSWRNRWFVPIVGQGSIELDVVPQAAPMNGYVAFTGRRSITDHGDNAVIIRFNNGGTVDAYDGDGYSAETVIDYQAGVARHLSIEVDLGAQRYDAAVDGVPVAVDYAFRTSVLSIGQLALWDASGELTAENLTVNGELATPDPACAGAGGAGAGGAGAGPGGGGAGAAGAGGGTGVVPASKADGGCGCSAAGAEGWGWGPLPPWIALLLLPVAWGRRKAPEGTASWPHGSTVVNTWHPHRR